MSSRLRGEQWWEKSGRVAVERALVVGSGKSREDTFLVTWAILFLFVLSICKSYPFFIYEDGREEGGKIWMSSVVSTQMLPYDSVVNCKKKINTFLVSCKSIDRHS